MELIKNELEKIIAENCFANVIYRTLESRPGELAKYISALANTKGGYILIGVEKDNNAYRIIGSQLGFHMETSTKSAVGKLSVQVECHYGNVNMGEKNIFAIKVEKSEEYVCADNVCYQYYANDAKVFVPKEPATLFISYSQCDTTIVEIIEKEIRNQMGNQIKISRYTELEYKASFKKFMNTIQDHDFVLTIVGDKYLKSQACMYEVGEIIKDHHYTDKLFLWC